MPLGVDVASGEKSQKGDKKKERQEVGVKENAWFDNRKKAQRSQTPPFRREGRGGRVIGGALIAPRAAKGSDSAKKKGGGEGRHLSRGKKKPRRSMGRGGQGVSECGREEKGPRVKERGEARAIDRREGEIEGKNGKRGGG